MIIFKLSLDVRASDEFSIPETRKKNYLHELGTDRLWGPSLIFKEHQVPFNRGKDCWNVKLITYLQLVPCFKKA